MRVRGACGGAPLPKFGKREEKGRFALQFGSGSGRAIVQGPDVGVRAGGVGGGDSPRPRSLPVTLVSLCIAGGDLSQRVMASPPGAWAGAPAMPVSMPLRMAVAASLTAPGPWGRNTVLEREVVPMSCVGAGWRNQRRG